MQINRNMSAVITNNQLLRIENKLSASMERLSSGLKLNRASDNPAGMAISNKMKAQIDALDKAESNASDAVSVLQIADGALGEVASILQRMRELSVQAANGTNAYSDRQSIQDEIDELKKEVDRISRDTEYNTKTLLDGSSDIRIYAEQASRFSATDTVAAQVYKMNVESAATKATVKLDYDVPAESGHMTINGVSVSVVAGMDKNEYLYGIRSAAEQAGCSVEVDEDTQQILITSNYYGSDESIEFTMSKELAESITLNNENKDCAYVVTEAEMKFSANQKPATGKIGIGSVFLDFEKIDDADYVDTMKQAAIDAGYTAVIEGNDIIIKSGSSDKMIEFSYSYDLATNLNIIGNYSGNYTVNTQGTDAKVEIPGDASTADKVAEREATGFTTTTTVNTKGNRVEITDNNGFSIGFLLDENYKKKDKDDTFELEVTEIGSLTIQIGANEHQDMDVRIGEVSIESLYIDTVDVAVEKGADRAMDVLEDALADLSAVRSRIGAFQNRLEYATNSLASAEENMTAAYSGLMDTDMAEEMTEYTQQNILSQAATSVLAQANDLPQQVLSLLQ